MATYSIAESGGDFTTLEAFVEDAGTVDGDVGEITGTWSASENTAIAVADALTIRCIGDAKHIGRPHSGSETTYRHRRSTGHSFTITDTGTITFEDMDIQNTGTGVSDELFRNNVSNTFIARRCVLGFDSRTDQQDIYYNEQVVDVTFENCHFYNAYRSVVDAYNHSNGSVVNINSCTAYDVGNSAAIGTRSGLVGITTTNTITVNIFNTVVDVRAGTPITSSSDSGKTFNCHTVITNSSDLVNSFYALNTDTSNVTSATITDSTASTAYILEDVTTSPYDLRLTDHANNTAQDNHTNSTGTGTGLSITSTDIVGVSRPQNTNHDIGAFEIEAAGDTDVLASTEALTITEQSASIALDVDVSAPTEALTITEYGATVSLGVDVAAATEALTITEQAATIVLDVDVGASTEALTITPYQAVVEVGGATNVQASTEALTITTNQAYISNDVDVACNTESLTLTTLAASTLLGTNVEASVAALTITENQATIGQDVDVGASTEQLTITPQPATIESSGATTLTPQDITNIVDALFAKVVENGETFEQQLKLIRAEAAGKVAVSGNTVSFRDAADSKDRIVATVDEQGQRTAITTDVS